MKNKIGFFLASLGFIGLMLTLLSEASQLAKSFLFLVFFVLVVIGILLETPIGNFFKENVEHQDLKSSYS